MEDLDLVNVTWCQDDSDYGATSASSDYDYEVTSASDRGGAVAGIARSLVQHLPALHQRCGDGQRRDLVD